MHWRAVSIDPRACGCTTLRLHHRNFRARRDSRLGLGDGHAQPNRREREAYKYDSLQSTVDKPANRRFCHLEFSIRFAFTQELRRL